MRSQRSGGFILLTSMLHSLRCEISLYNSQPRHHELAFEVNRNLVTETTEPFSRVC
jgi:hypothetical protein